MAKCYWLLQEFYMKSEVIKLFGVFLIIIWIIVTYPVIWPYRCNENLEEITVLREKLKLKSAQLLAMVQRNKKLMTIQNLGFLKFNILKDLTSDIDLGPSEEYENLRHRIYTNTKELWSYVVDQHRIAREELKVTKFNKILEEIADRKRSLLSDQEKLPAADGHAEWRQKEARIVSDLILRRLRHLQNPPDCPQARKLVCDLNKNGGFGCQIHHVVYCLSFGYATNRTVVLNSTGWQYSASGWESFFHPISICDINSVNNDSVVEWAESANDKVLYIPFIESISPKPDFILPALPEDLAHRIVRFNGNPLSWWIGQMVKYILKPLNPIQNVVNKTISNLNTKSPIVGIHIRRTDKINAAEAVYHDFEEYMDHVAEYYAQLELTRHVDERRVYIATDDIEVLQELEDVLRTKYHQYKFLVVRSIIESAALGRRYTRQALEGLLADLRVLSTCDYVVCTFSSNIGRLIYELMQSNRDDATNTVSSLDDVYYFSNIYAQDRIAVMSNVGGDDDISLEVGDQIGLVPGGHRDGYDLGTNKRTLITGLIPWYKTVEDLALYRAPKYEEL